MIKPSSSKRVIVDTTVMAKASAYPLDQRCSNAAAACWWLRPKEKNKLYAVHAPGVECISQGKARARYEFGVKVSIVTMLKEGVLVRARSMPGNPYNCHTLPEALEQAEIVSDVKPEMVFVDRSYRGVAIDHVQV